MGVGGWGGGAAKAERQVAMHVAGGRRDAGRVSLGAGHGKVPTPLNSSLSRAGGRKPGLRPMTNACHACTVSRAVRQSHRPHLLQGQDLLECMWHAVGDRGWARGASFARGVTGRCAANAVQPVISCGYTDRGVRTYIAHANPDRCTQGGGGGVGIFPTFYTPPVSNKLLHILRTSVGSSIAHQRLSRFVASGIGMHGSERA